MIAISIPSTNLLLLRIRCRKRHTIARNDPVEAVLDFILDPILYVLDGTGIILIRTLSFCSFMLVYHKRTPPTKRRFCRCKHAILQKIPLQKQILTNNDYIMETDRSELRCCSQRLTLQPRPLWPFGGTLFTRWKETPRSPRYTSMECSSYDRLIPAMKGVQAFMTRAEIDHENEWHFSALRDFLREKGRQKRGLGIWPRISHYTIYIICNIIFSR